MSPVWRHTLKLRDVFHDEDKLFVERRDAIVARIKSAAWFKRADGDDDDLCAIVTDLAEAETTDDFDESWRDFYDWADENRVWVETV